jgi:hypothetical protein
LLLAIASPFTDFTEAMASPFFVFALAGPEGGATFIVAKNSTLSADPDQVQETVPETVPLLSPHALEKMVVIFPELGL